MDLLDHNQGNEQDRNNQCCEDGEQYSHRPFVRKIGSNLDLQRIVRVVGDHFDLARNVVQNTRSHRGGRSAAESCNWE